MPLSFNTIRYNQLSGGSEGKILQAVTATKTDTFSSTSTSFTDLTDITANITPASTDNKVFINVSLALANSSTVGGWVYVNFVRGSTNILLGDTASNRTRCSFQVHGIHTGEHVPHTYFFLDSPSTTSATTYKVQVKTNTGTIYLNRSSRDNDHAAYDGRSTSTITLMEVGA